MRTRVLLVTALLVLSGCSDDDSGDVPAETDSSQGSTPAAQERLPTGKNDLELGATDYLSPEGFEPELEIALGQSGLAGWTSVHRGADAFDLGQPNPNVDAPLVAVVFMVPKEGTAAEALEALRQRAVDAGAEVTDTSGPFGSVADAGITLRDGDGQVVSSRDGSIALDAVPGGRLQVWAADDGDDPLLVVVFTPDATMSADADALVQELAGSVTFA